jgi:hypothetical protein
VSPAIGIDRVELVRHEDIGFPLGIGLDVPERVGQHADHRGRPRVDVNRSPEDVPIAAEPSLPEPMVHDDHARAVGLVLLCGEWAPEDERGSDRREEPRRDAHAAHPLGRARRIRDREEADPPVGAGPFERLRLPGEVQEVSGREVVGLTGLAVEPDDLHQPLRRRVRQRAQQHCLHDAEHRGVGAERQGEGDEGRGAESRAPDEPVQGQA